MRLPFNGNFPQTQGFGVNPENYKKYGLLGHNGLDYGLPSGTPVVAPHKGFIKEAYFDPLGYGWYIKLENDTEGSTLAHLEEGSFRVKIGDFVDEGQFLALSDNTGFSTRPHLHSGYYRFPRNRQNGFNGYIDQTPYLIPDPPVGNGIPPTTGVSKEQIIIDSYHALTGEYPSDDEKRFRLSQNLNTDQLIESICSGDGRFYNKWVKPHLSSTQAPETVKTSLSGFSQAFQSVQSSIANLFKSHSSGDDGGTGTS